MKKTSITIVALLAVGAAISFASGGSATKVKRGLKTTVNEIAWFNQFEDAKKEAAKTKKPILLLSMFGEIDEQMPCANARTLRATLFKDPDFKKLVGLDVIPAWEMVRAVPKIEIDLGDGRKIKRTVRGNAVMYLCNADGKVVDAFPGIYTKSDFMPMIRESIEKVARATEGDVFAFHKSQPLIVPRSIPLTTSKMMAESPTLNLIGAESFEGATPTTLKKEESKERRQFLAAARRVRDMSLIPANSEEVMFVTTGKNLSEVAQKDRASMILAKDSERNTTMLRPVIHLWFNSMKSLPTPGEAREAVLETILKIPYKDPYFGLKDVIIPGTPE